MDHSPASSQQKAHRVADALGDVAPAGVIVVNEGDVRERIDWLVVEEPLEIRVGGPGREPESLAVTMRTPGNDRELAVGFLVTEGLISEREEIEEVEGPRAGCGGGAGNVVKVRLRGEFDGARGKRNFFATSSCGICGKASLEQVAVRCPPVGEGLRVGRGTLIGLPETLRGAQEVFERTGGLHAAGLFDEGGRLLILREDVGRHNAVDKLIGHAFLKGEVPLGGRILLVSGRTSFEILQKVAVAGVPIVCAVSAPSSLAVSVAERLGITLVGFLRGASFNVYTHPERINLDR